MTADELVAALESVGVHATVTTSEHRTAGEREEGVFDVLTLHLPNGSIAIGAGAEDAYDAWVEAHPAPSVAAL